MITRKREVSQRTSLRNLNVLLPLAALLLLVFPFSSPLIAQSNAELKSHAVAKARLTVNGFIENKGQFVNSRGKLIPEVLFKASLEGVDVYITTDGISYVFTRMVRDKRKERGRAPARLESDESGRMSWRRVDMRLVGAKIRRQNVVAERPVAQGYFNYYLSHRPQGITGVNAFHQITIREIYPGIDWRLSDDGARGFKQEFIVHPGARPNDIRMKYIGAGKVAERNNGSSLRITTTLGEIEEGALVSHQGDPNQPVISRYKVLGNVARFVVGNYDAQRELVIDPPLHLVWATLYGGNSSDGPSAVAFDTSNNVYVVGYTSSTNFPTQSMGSAYVGPANIYTFNIDAFILKFDHTGVRLWATYYGSFSSDSATGVVTDASGNLYVTGYTLAQGNTFPTMAPASSMVTVQTNSNGSYEAFLLKFNSSGVRQWATLYGGNGDDQAKGITADPAGDVYIVGTTLSFNLPVNPPPAGASNFQPNIAGVMDAFVVKFSSSGARAWATYYGGSDTDVGWAITWHGFPQPLFGGVYVVGSTYSLNLPLKVWPGGYNQSASGGKEDAFILAIGSNGNRQWATYYGASGFDAAYAAASSSHALYITGSSTPVSSTPANAFPSYNTPAAGSYYQPAYSKLPPYPSVRTPNYSDAFILRFDHAGQRHWATLFGGTERDSGQGVTVDKLNNVHVAGLTSSPDLPLYNPGGNVFFDNSLSGAQNVFIASFGPAGVQQWTTYAGGAGFDFPRGIGASSLNCLFVTGEFNSQPATLPLLNPGGAYFQNTSSIINNFDEGFIMKFCY